VPPLEIGPAPTLGLQVPTHDALSWTQKSGDLLLAAALSIDKNSGFATGGDVVDIHGGDSTNEPGHNLTPSYGASTRNPRLAAEALSRCAD
jgi:hypothetical protein